MAEHGTRRHRNKLIFLMVAGAIGIGLLIIGGYQLIEFTDTVAFCGRLCHSVMYPEYTAYQASPHSRVQCAQCHVGSGADYLVRSKISGVPLIFATLTGNYDRPIPTPVKNLRPARETCEQCHRPERFTGDFVITHTTYAADEGNTPTTDVRVMRVGGGPSAGATGIHWHIASTVYYLPLDEKRQDIAWVRVVRTNGSEVEYVNPTDASQVTPERIKKDERLMDCIDCHNRATHIFQSPEELIDAAITEGRIDVTLPFIKREGMSALDPANPGLAEAYAKIDAIRDFYQTNYPEIASDNSTVIDQAITALKNVAVLTTFPEMKVNWNTYQNELGHIQSPGCFRCHGKLVATSGPQQGQAIDASCDLCHYFQLPQGTAQ